MRSFRSFVRFTLGRSPRRRCLLLGPVVLLALLGAGLAWWADHGGRPALRYRFVPGRRLVYQLEYFSAAAVDLNGLSAGQAVAGTGLSRSAHVAVEGELAVSLLEADGPQVRLAYRLARPTVRVAVDGQRELALGEALEADLQRPLFAQADRSGRIASVRLSPAQVSVSSSFSRALLAASQVVLPGATADGPSRWEAEEDDLHGTAVVRYRAVAGRTGWDGPLRTLRKAKARYLRPPGANAEDGAPGVALEHRPEGELEATVDVQGQHLVALKGTEVTTALAQDRTVGRTETTLRLRLLRCEAATAAEVQELEAEAAARAGLSPPVPLSAPPDAEAAEAAVQQAELGKATLETLLAELAKAEAGAPAALGETALYLKFQALVYLRPEVSAELGRRLASAPAGGLVLRVLGPALANSGRPEAQAALAEVVRARRHDGPALAELLPALGLAKAPTPVLEAALFELAAAGSGDSRATAELALGTLARGLAGWAPARADGIVRWAVGRLEGARSPGERRQLLLVLGNAGAAQAWPAVRRHLSAAEPEVRGGAVTALRWLKGPEVEAALCGALTADADAGVRLEAARALGVRRMTAAALAAHAAALRADGSASVRLAVLRNLGRARAALPGAAELVREAAAKGPDREVRAAAAELLEEES
jgi:hypothetical protein